MKKLSKHFLLLFIKGALFASCNNAGSTKTEASADTTANKVVAKQVNYSYSVDHPDYWETGSQQNTLNALNALKEWENKNMDASLKYFADSVFLEFDGINKMVSNDTLKEMLTPPIGVDYSIKMQDWEGGVCNAMV